MGGNNSKQRQDVALEIGESNSKQWVILAAGSNGWINYRHQANVCHAYQMVHENGIPNDQIVVMMYDDIAYNQENPYRGEIINVPDGPNVYPGVPKDYTGSDVLAQNFLAALAGEKDKVPPGKKVLKSTKDDTIFIYLSDHGGHGTFVFPDDLLFAADLIEKINEMANKNKFSTMVIYVESCYSGTMLENLPSNVEGIPIVVYGVSASSPYEPHYACFWDKQRKAFLSGEFTSWWLRHMETSDLTKTTFKDQFEFLKSNMKESTPYEYGNKNTGRLAISAVLGSPQRPRSNIRAKDFKPTDLTPNQDVPLVIQMDKIERETDPSIKRVLQREYHEMYKMKKNAEQIMQQIALLACTKNGPRAVKERHQLTRLPEMKEVTMHFRSTFSHWHKDQHNFALSHMHVIVNLCELGVDVARINKAITCARIHQDSTEDFQFEQNI